MGTVRTIFSILMILNFLLLTSCKEDDLKPSDEDKILGKWISYEGVANGDTSTNATLFNTFYTGIGFTDNGYYLFTEPAPGNIDSVLGTWEIDGKTVKLFDKEGKLWKTATIEEISDNELWWRYEENNLDKLMKFKRK